MKRTKRSDAILNCHGHTIEWLEEVAIKNWNQRTKETEPMNNNDEKIREALIKFHKSTIDIDGVKGEDIVAWIEKQQTMSPEEMLDLLKMDYSKGRYDAITKAIEWLDEHLLEYWGQQNSDPSEFFVNFKKAMEGE